ncbi:MAG: 16S rRNA (uracil(1498)-N(3))-methyltransferase [Eubacterium sp.]|nr:16S rRNA (uracil(1498)-N(3))-methyltransferase [Eubacterium sp.]
MRRVFVPPEQVGEDRIIVRGDDVKHMRDVLRMSEGSSVTATCGRGTDYHCEIASINGDEIDLRILEAVPDVAELPVRISLYQALPKGDKLELIIQKAVELGVSEIIPIRTARCVVRLDETKAAKKQTRWQKIAEEAAKQSGRGLVPEVLPVMDFSAAVKRAAGCDHVLIPYELCEDFSTIDRLREGIREEMMKSQRSSDSKSQMSTAEPVSDGGTPPSIAVFIGSEGGFERSEVEQVLAAGGEEISLGHRILRTETAAIAVLAHLMLTIEAAQAE